MANTAAAAAPATKWMENFKPERHNLFLSHAGEDKAFVRILHEDLKKRHHSPFLDQERDSLPLGSHFPTTILEAICKCQVIVFILSEHFVTKKWPMLELAEAWRQPQNKRPIMFPIFYKLNVGRIDRANLNKWKEIWGTQAKNDPQVDADTFAQALQCLTKLSGVRNSGGLDDFKFAKEVISEICRQVTPIKLWANDAMEKEKDFCTELSRHFQHHSGNCTILGMWGGSGTGKTWIAMALCRHFYKEYCGWVHLIDLSKKKDKLAMARAMYLSLSGEEMEKNIDSEQMAQVSLQNFIKGKSFFLVLDNPTWTKDGKGIIEFALEMLNYCKECKVLITAREKEFLDSLLEPYKNAALVIDVPSLDEEAAVNILLRLACPKREPDTLTLEEQRAIHEVCMSHLEYVDFNPFLTKGLGMYIARSGKNAKEPTSWPALVNADANLKKDLDSRLNSILNEQFQSMTANHLRAFYIDAAIYDFAIETTLSGICHWLSIIHGFRPKTVLKKLQEVAHNGFLKWDGFDSGDDEADLDEFEEDPEIITDDMFAKFAMSQVLENPEKWGWFFYNGIAEEEEETQTGTLLDNERQRSNRFAPPRPKEVKSIEKIAVVGGKFEDVGEVLNLTRYTKAIALVFSRCNQVEELNVEWNTHLKTFEVEHCAKLQKIEGLEDLTQLVCLRVISTPIREVQLRLDKLLRLQKLEICSTNLSKAPNLQGCFKLRELILEDNPLLQALPECWSGFSSLTKISFASNSNIVELPDLSPLASVLCYLDISFCTKLEFAACIPTLTALETLCLDFCTSLAQLPDLRPLTDVLRDNSVPKGLHPEAKRAWLDTFRTLQVYEAASELGDDDDIIDGKDDEGNSDGNDDIIDGNDDEGNIDGNDDIIDVKDDEGNIDGNDDISDGNDDEGNIDGNDDDSEEGKW